MTAIPNKVQYEAGEEVELVPRPEAGYCFRGWGGDAHGAGLVLRLTMDTSKAVTATFGPWTPPLGIPMPEFGVFETHRMYEGKTYDFGSGPESYKDAGNGPYSHYVDNAHPSATDTANPYGTPDKPRRTIPSTLAGGSVVEIHGGPYVLTSVSVTANGTQERPVFVRGMASQRPQFSGTGLYLWGCYLIVENLEIVNGNLFTVVQSQLLYPEPHHVSVRNCELHDKIGARQSGISIDSYNTTAPNSVNNLVFYGNTVHDLGDFAAVEAGLDNDFTGIAVGDHANHIWIVDNIIYNTTGSGIGINAGNSADAALTLTTNHIFVGRNTIHGVYQSGLGLKRSVDVIISENTAFNIKPRDTGTEQSPGKGFSFQYGPDRIWFLCNTAYGCEYGLFSASASGRAGGAVYVIGNLFYGMTTNRSTVGLWSYRHGIQLTDDENMAKYVIGNTIHDATVGIGNARGTGPLYLANNLFSDIDNEHIWIDSPTRASLSSLDNSLFDGTARIKWGSDTIRDVAAMQSVFGKGAGCLEAAPRFTDAARRNFSLQSASPAIDRGIAAAVYQQFYALYGIDIRKDINGNSRTGTWDIGAYEYVLRALTDLAVSGTSQNALTLTWTVSGEPGVTGTPTGYDIRYADSPITEANWEAATQVPGEPIAGAFGQAQSFTIVGLDPGSTYYVGIKALAEGGHTSTLSNVVPGTTSTAGGHTPVMAAVGDKSVNITKLLTFTLSANDADGGNLTYSAAGLPSGATFTGQTFAWTPATTQEGSYPVTFTVSDGQRTHSQTIKILVTDPTTIPVLAAIGNQSVNENETLSFSLSAVDADNNPITYTARG
ncbi:MAG: right-handed parallel beta-helix repeat-containing protein, partial [Planctomycetes bacterium]|nr:right-handed parallel beta-helix repeat-containing protein [Planctomycetota bacterium]